MEQKPSSPASSTASLRSDWSKDRPLNFGNDQSRPLSPAYSDHTARSDWSEEEPPDLGNDELRPSSPAFSTASLRSDWSKDRPLNFGNDQSRPLSPAYSDHTARSDRSEEEPPDLGNDELRPSSPAFSTASLRSDWSKDRPLNFGNDQSRPLSPAYSDHTARSDRSEEEPPDLGNDELRPSSSAFSTASLRSDWSKDRPLNFGNDQSRPLSPAYSDHTARSDWSEEEPPDLGNEELSTASVRSDCFNARPPDSGNDEQRPSSPASSTASLRSDLSQDRPLDFGNDQSRPPSPAYSDHTARSDRSKEEPPDLGNEELRSSSPASSTASIRPPDSGNDEQRPSSPASSTASLRSDLSKDRPLNFGNDQSRPLSPAYSDHTARSDQSKEELLDLGNEELRSSSPASSTASVRSDCFNARSPDSGNDEQRPSSPASSTASLRSDLSQDRPLDFGNDQSSPPESQVLKYQEDDPHTFTEDDPQQIHSSENIMPRLKKKVKEKVLDQYETELRGLKEDSELYVTTGDKDVPQTCNNIFINSEKKAVRTVLTEGVAGIGKTFQTRKLMVDWAKGKSNTSIDLIVPLSLSELKTEGEEHSMEDLLDHFLEDEKWKRRKDCISECKLALILDDFQECKSRLDFENSSVLTDIGERASIDVLLTNLIRGDLLPDARLWIISRPSGTDKVPPELIDKVTRCRETLKRRKDLVSKLKERYRREYTPVEDPDHSNQKNTEHILKEHSTEDGKTDQQTKPKSVTQVTVSDIFEARKDKKVRTVLTVGEAQIGKSFQVQKFIKAWADDKTLLSRLYNYGKGWISQTEDIEVLFPFDLSKSDFKEAKKSSLLELLNSLFEETKKYVISDYSKFKLVFLLDGLDAFPLPLDFDHKAVLDDIRQPASVGLLLTSLIRGDLLPSARLWITSQPSAAEKLPPDCVDKKTEIRDIIMPRLIKKVKEKVLGQYETELRKLKKDSELYVTTGDKDVPQTYNDIFINSEKKTVRTVLTEGVAGIGKTFQTRKLMVDWAKGKSNTSIDLIVPLSLSELKTEGEKHSMEDLLDHFLEDEKWKRRKDCISECELALILDDFQECKSPLDFENSSVLTDIGECASIDVLLTNLIRGDLLPDARLWIISRPSGTDKVPPERIHKVTQCRETLKRREDLVSKLKERYHREYTPVEDPDHSNQKNTEHILKEHSTEDGKTDQQTKPKPVTQVTVSDIFEARKDKKVRTVLTVGEAQIGKSFQVQKFIKAWAGKKTLSSRQYNDGNNRISQTEDIEVLFPFDLSKSDFKEAKNSSLLELLNSLFEETKKYVISDYSKFKLVFLLDGLDAFPLPLDFDHKAVLDDIRQPASVGLLLTSLIRGDLLPSARLWITSQPSAAEKLPPDCVDKKTEIRDIIMPRLIKKVKEKVLGQYETELRKLKKDSELYVTTGDKDVPQTYNDIFINSEKKTVRTVLTEGVAGIGKTFQTRKLMVDWAKGKSNTSIDLIVPLSLSELKTEGEKHSMEDLLDHFLEDEKWKRRKDCISECELALILDDFQECKSPLDFENSSVLTDIGECASIDVLLTNLIRGDLLPDARLWIISRPSGTDKVPPERIHKVTQCRETLKRREDLVSKLKERYHREYTPVEDPDHSNQKNTEHILKEHSTEDGKTDQQTKPKPVTQVTVSDIFEARKDKKVRTVLTVGEAQIGKSFQVQKFIKAWAGKKTLSSRQYNDGNNRISQTEDIEVLFPFDLSKSDFKEAKNSSLLELLNSLFEETKKYVISDYSKFKLVFLLDGLDAFPLPLDFDHKAVLDDIRQPASVGLLLTSLIRGDLLPSARLWITSQPSAAEKLPPDCVDKKTEIRDIIMPRLIKKVKEKVLGQYETELRKLKKDSELYVTTGDKDVPQTCNDIFINSEKKAVRTVLTEGVAGIGKTFQTRKLMVDWAKGKSNTSIDLIVPLSLSELKTEGEEHSMEDLLDHFLEDEKWKRRKDCISECELALILDDFQECKRRLDFENSSVLTDIGERASIDVLLTNLIRGDLLPDARLWIISRPSGTDKVPPERIHKVTRCRETSKRREDLISKLKERYRREYTPVEDPDHSNQKNTEHILKEHSTEDGKTDQQTKPKSVTQVTVSDIFEARKDKKVRTVLTVGEAQIGKSFQVQKFIKAWADDKTLLSRLYNDGKKFFSQTEDIEVLFPFDLSKSDFKEAKKSSLLELLNGLFEETKKYVISDYAKFKLVFLLDGLDAFPLPLDFDHKAVLDDIRQPASVGLLLTSLIRGDLLPSARLWITSQPSAAEKLPPDCVDKKTEIREKPDITSTRTLKSQLKRQLTYVTQGTDKRNTSAVLKEIYTDLYIIEGDRGDVNKKHEVRQIDDARSVRKETPIEYSDIFKNAPEGNIPIKTVLTIGVAGIGKTFASMKYVLDWAESPADETVDYTFLLPFRELNLRKDQEHSFEELIHQLFPAMKTSEIRNYDNYKILIVLDGLDECRLDLNFSENVIWTDVRKKTTVNVLLTNLIRGKLLPKAQIWITSRPAASNNIPPDAVNRVTEVRGFNEKQKEEYFRKRFVKKEIAEEVISEVKKSRSLFIMCYIPVFCWITSNVMEDIMKKDQKDVLPKTLTYMYTRFLLLQCEQANVKYEETETSDDPEADSCLNTRNRETVLALGKLAFEELEKGNLVFPEEYLVECGINIRNAAVLSGLFTQIMREGCGLYPQKLFCFVHLSIQEFVAALYVSHRFTNNGENVFTSSPEDSESPASDFYTKAVDKALESKNGDWDLFLRFLLGLSLATHQNLLPELLKTPENNKETYQETVEHIKKKIREVDDPEKKQNLFHCLNELNDDSLVEEVKKSLETRTFENFSPSQWSALTFVLLTSDLNLDVFDLKNYLKSETVLLGMLPVVKVSETTLLSWCDLTEKSCSGLMTSVLSSPSSNLTVLDMSNNDLKDAGIQRLAEGLKSIHCKLKNLKVSGCQVTEKGCSYLASALKENTGSHLKELDLSYNHPGESGVKELSAVFADPRMKLCVNYGGEHRLKPGIKKYDALLKFDENTISRRLVVVDQDKRRKVKTVELVEEKVARPENDDRFKRTQVLCDKGLEDLGYWEVEWQGMVGIAVSYNDVGRKWDNAGGLGCNEKSWSLMCSSSGFMGRDGKMFTGFIARHGKMSKHIKVPCCQKIAVYLDWKAGTLSYYGVSSDERSLIHTFRTKFTGPLFPGFWFKEGSVTLCDL
ncbi:uncharacterized protein LOC115407882 isoform X4 [Salarias fasciatus]|uniref:uncharacterized protein LOC115407882 isoform X4 n=1 Tax=Salarias fasciatus TaxID=181472 RepID=UPI0011765C4F|nr:uncharacterized protein LOC115407882 isoform X4 [Salarias fasciatus]